MTFLAFARALVTAYLLTTPLIYAQQQYEIGKTYRFTLRVGDVKTARLVAIDSASLYVLPHNDTDAEFIPLSQILAAAEVASRDHVVTLSAVGLFVGIISPTYYQKLSDGLFLGAGPRIYGYRGTFGGLVEARHYTAENGPYGFYIGPNVGYIPTFAYPMAQDDEEDDVITVGVVLGWQWFPSYRFGLGFGFSLDAIFPVADVGRATDVDQIMPLVMYRGDIAWAW